MLYVIPACRGQSIYDTKLKEEENPSVGF